MPKSKWVFLLFSCLMLAGGVLYWQQDPGESALGREQETAARAVQEQEVSEQAVQGEDSEAEEQKPEEAAAQKPAESAEPESSAPEEWIFATEALMVNINTAGVSELEKLPGIGPGKARAIVEYRQQKGPFRSIEELMQVPGIKEGTFARLKAYVTV